MRVAQEEIFGPVASVITFKNEDDYRQANEAVYGLRRASGRSDIARAPLRESGQSGRGLDQHLQHVNAASPFGGYKQSGYGREMGKHALEMYTQVKSVWVDLSGKPIGWFGK